MITSIKCKVDCPTTGINIDVEGKSTDNVEEMKNNGWGRTHTNRSEEDRKEIEPNRTAERLVFRTDQREDDHEQIDHIQIEL